jgi:ribosomal-protein-alanine N-acetyltransferase
MSAQPFNVEAHSIRMMGPDDLDAIIALEKRAYEFPWSRSIFSDCLLAGYYCIVLEVNSVVMGYAIMSVAAAEGHILNLCIDSALRKRGLGRKMLHYLLAHVNARNLERLFLEVRPSNIAAIALYTSTGFDRLGARKGYYKARDGREDALVFVREFQDEDD